MKIRKAMPGGAIFLLLFSSIPMTPDEVSRGEKVAEGQYQYLVPVGQVLNEDWVLYRDKGGYRVESREGDNRNLDLVIESVHRLDEQFRVVWWESKLARLGTGKVSRQFGCRISQERIVCWDGDAERVIDEANVSGILTLFPSAWFLVNLVRTESAPSDGKENTIKVLYWDVGDGLEDMALGLTSVIASAGIPKTHVLNGKPIRVLERSFRFLPQEGDVAEAGEVVIGVTSDGIVAWARAAQGNEETGSVELVRYEKYAEFGPGVE